MTSEPKPGALAPAGVGRSILATAGSASVARAVAAGGGVISGISSYGGLGRGGGPHPTGSRASSQAGSGTSSGALTQPAEKPGAGIAVGRLDAGFALIIAHRERRRAANAAVGATGIEAERGEPVLDLLQFEKRRRRFA